MGKCQGDNIPSPRGLKNLKITHKRVGNKNGYRMVLNGNIKGYQRTRCNLIFGQLRNFVVSHGLFLKIKGGQAVFIFI
jgi:hypothetical protein